MPTAETSFSGYPQHSHSQQQQLQNFQQKQQQNKQQNRQHLYHNNQMLPSLLSPETSPLQTNNVVVPSVNYTPQQHQKQQQRQQEYHQHQQYQQTHPSSVIANTQQHYDVYQQQHHLMFGQNYQHYNQQMGGQHPQAQPSQHSFPKNNVLKNNVSRQQNVVGVNYNNYPSQQHYSQQKHQQQHLEGRGMFEQTSFNYQQQQCSNYQQQKHQQTLPLQHQQQHFESTQQQQMLPQQQTMVKIIFIISQNI